MMCLIGWEKHYKGQDTDIKKDRHVPNYFQRVLFPDYFRIDDFEKKHLEVYVVLWLASSFLLDETKLVNTF